MNNQSTIKIHIIQLIYCFVIFTSIFSLAEAAPISKALIVNQSQNTIISLSGQNIAMDASGNVVITWESNVTDDGTPGFELLSQDGSYGGIYARKLNADGNFVSDEFLVNQTTDSSQRLPAIAVENDGNFTIVWTSFFDLQPYLRKFDAMSSAITDETQVATSIKQSGAAEIGIDGASRQVITWFSNEDVNSIPSYHNIYARILNFDGTPITGKFLVNETVKWPNTHSKIDVNINGEFVVVWESQTTDPGSTPGLAKNSPDGSGYAIFARKFDSSGTPITTDILVNTTTEKSQRSPSVALDNNGSFVIVWQDQGQKVIMQQRFDNIGGKIAGEETISLPSSGISGPEMNPSLDMDATGGYVVSWTTNIENVGHSFVVRQFNKDGIPVSDEVYINRGGYNTDIAVNSDGSFVITWNSSSNGLDQIYVRYFDSQIIVPFTDEEETKSSSNGGGSGGSFNLYLLLILCLARTTGLLVWRNS